MRNFHNIEARKFPGKDYYVGYGRLCSVWHIKGKSGNWYCTPSPSSTIQGVSFFARTLSEVSKELDCR